MRSAAATVAERGADMIDLNMGCPVPKVCKTGAGAALIKDPDTAVAVARAAREGSGLPVTVKLRSGARTGETDGFALALRLVEEAGRRAIAFHPRSAQVHHKGAPDYELAAPARRGAAGAGDPLRRPARRRARARRLRADRRRRGDARPRLARQPVAVRAACSGRATPSRRTAEVVAELGWVIDRAVEHLGEERAARYLRKFYPWYLEPPGGSAGRSGGFQARASVDDARALIARSSSLRPLAAAGAGRSLYCPPAGRSGRLRHALGVSLTAAPVSLHAQRRHPHARRSREAQGRAGPSASDRRREVAERIKEAREFGDISENSEYDDAKNEQAMLEARIAQLEERLRGGHRHRRRRRSRPTSSASARSSTSRTRRPASRRSSRSSARPRPTRPRASSPTSRRSAARCSATSATRSSRCRSRAAPRAS